MDWYITAAWYYDFRSIFFVLAYLLEIVGYTSFKANIVQYNIDQLVGASADELSILALLQYTGIGCTTTMLLFQILYARYSTSHSDSVCDTG